MPPSGPSMLSLIAAGYYMVVLLACLAATTSAVLRGQIASHWRSWVSLALLFAILITLRVLDLEAMARDALREFLVATDSYDDRRRFQGVFVVVIAVILALGAALWFFKNMQGMRGRRDIAVIVAQAAGFALVALIALRTVSLSALDKLLFGPLKLNWIADIGASTAVAGAAVYYVWVVSTSARANVRESGK